VICIYH